MARSLIAIAILVSSTACLHDEVHQNEGTVCLLGEGTAQIVYPDSPSEITVTYGCASACAEDIDTSCDVRVDGNDVTINSRFAFDVPDDACIALCASLEARCELPGLAEGKYVVRHGGAKTPLAVGQPAPSCF